MVTQKQTTHEALAHLTLEGAPHLLADHLRDVGALAEEFAAHFGAGAWARIAGLWHDLGKYSPNFQKRIREENGFEAHIEDPNPDNALKDHSSAGAVHARERLGALGMPLAFVIAGHHAGLADRADLEERLAKRKVLLEDARLGGAPESLLLEATPERLPFVPSGGDDARRRLEFWTRMLFSALCDADFLDTERFYDARRSAARGQGTPLEHLQGALRAHLAQLEASAREGTLTEVDRVRAEVRAACEQAAELPPGFFTLTVPTGGGKTLASMHFALAHAARHGLRRVVVAVPYMAIIEQNTDAYRAAFGEGAARGVVEHFSALDPRRETWRNRLASENWDAPVIVTTTVQLFESMFGHRTSRCRKLHNLARAVVVLDEAQTLPVALINPIVDGLRVLVADYGATVVFCTATQPAFRAEDSAARKPEPWRVAGMREIVSAETRAFERLRRVTVRWPASAEPTPYSALAAELADESDVLAIVHRRRDARALTEYLDACVGHAQTVHLSALMTPSHRSRCLAGLMERRRKGDEARVVATQLVEAGVNLDFPVVYRALAGMDAMAQAAGRCNREGRRPKLGELRLFVAETEPPPGVLQRALAVTRSLLAEADKPDLFAPETHRRFFTRLYRLSETDASRIQELRAAFRFRSVSEAFEMIEDRWSAPVVIPEAEALDALDALRADGPSRQVFRRLQRHTVHAPRVLVEAWVRGGQCEVLAESVVVLREVFAKAAYSERFGLDPEAVGAGVIDPALLMG